MSKLRERASSNNTTDGGGGEAKKKKNSAATPNGQPKAPTWENPEHPGPPRWREKRGEVQTLDGEKKKKVVTGSNGWWLSSPERKKKKTRKALGGEEGPRLFRLRRGLGRTRHGLTGGYHGREEGIRKKNKPRTGPRKRRLGENGAVPNPGKGT